MGINRPRIAHVVDSPPEKGLDGCPEVEGDHARCYGTHTGGLHARRGCLVGLLRALGGAIIAGNTGIAGIVTG